MNQLTLFVQGSCTHNTPLILLMRQVLLTLQTQMATPEVSSVSMASLSVCFNVLAGTHVFYNDKRKTFYINQ